MHFIYCDNNVHLCKSEEKLIIQIIKEISLFYITLNCKNKIYWLINNITQNKNIKFSVHLIK